MIMHNMESPKQLSVITVGVTCLKLSKRSDCVSFLEHKTPKLHPHRSLQLYNHWPQSQSQVSNKRRTPLQRIPFLATCFSCLPKPVSLCSSSLKMFDNVVNGPSKPKICKADGCFFFFFNSSWWTFLSSFWDILEEKCADHNFSWINWIVFISAFKPTESLIQHDSTGPTWTQKDRDNIKSSQEGFSPLNMQQAAGY